MPTGKKEVEQYIKQIIKIALRVKHDFKDVYETGKTKNIVKLLELIKRFDIKQFYLIKEKTRSKRLMDECRVIYSLTDEAIRDVKETWTFDKAEQVVDKIISLEGYLKQDLNRQYKFIPSKNFKRVLSFSPKQAEAKGILFRGLAQNDWERILRGQDIHAKVPQSHVPIINHILDPTNNPNTQFISLSSDPKTARRFVTGGIIAVERKKLKGHIVDKKEFELLTRGSKGTDVSKAKVFLRKNSEFILSPTKKSFAIIPAESVIH